MSEKTLSQWLGYLEQLHPSEIELGLERIRKIAERMDVLEPAPLVITVTGTNGKGSTCAFLAQLLSAQGMRVGVYSSPHFLRYNERIQIAGEPVADELICAAFAQIEQVRADTSLTYFEFGTLAALQIFTRSQLDAVILEVGLGGRLDAVNIVEPDIAVITTIALDHADWLGTSREQVAQEKAGIMRSGKPVVCGDPQPPANLQQLAQEYGAQLYLRGRDFDLQQQAHSWSWQSREHALHELPLLDLPMQNAAVALQVFELLQLGWQPQQIAAALRETKITGRLQRVEYRNKRLLLDVAHNPQAAEYLAQRLQQRQTGGRRLAVFGALNDKDVPAVISAMAPVIASWAGAELPSPRSYTQQQLAQMLETAGVGFKLYPDIAAALESQVQQAGADDEILVFGSFFTVARVLEHIGLSG